MSNFLKLPRQLVRMTILVWLVSSTGVAQTEYVRINGRVVAIERTLPPTYTPGQPPINQTLSLNGSPPATVPTVFSFEYSDQAGPNSIGSGLTQFIPKNDPSLPRCSIYWARPNPATGAAGYIFLEGQNGNAMFYAAAGSTPGRYISGPANQTSSNGVCSITAVGSYFSGTFNSINPTDILTEALQVTFLQGQTYDVNITAFDNSGNQSPYQSVGTVTVTAAPTYTPGQPPINQTLSLNGSPPATVPTVFSFEYSDQAGPNSIGSGLTQFVPKNDPSLPRCSIYWARPNPATGAAGYIFLEGQNGNAMFYAAAGSTPGRYVSGPASQTSSNNVCSVTAANSYFSGTFNSINPNDILTVVLQVTFLQGQTYDVNVTAFDNSGNQSPYQSVGTVTVTAAASISISVSSASVPSSAGSGSFTVNSTGGQGWVIQSQSYWLSAGPSSGSSASSLVTFSYGVNPASTPRTGTLTIAPSPANPSIQTLTFSVNQDAAAQPSDFALSLLSSSITRVKLGNPLSLNLKVSPSGGFNNDVALAISSITPASGPFSNQVTPQFSSFSPSTIHATDPTAAFSSTSTYNDIRITPGQYQVSIAATAPGISHFLSVTVVVDFQPSVVVSPVTTTTNYYPTTIHPGGGTVQFSASVQGLTPNTVTWSVVQLPGATCSGGIGTINSSGLYTAPTTIPNSCNAKIVATSNADTTQIGGTVITFLQNFSPDIELTPSTLTLDVTHSPYTFRPTIYDTLTRA